MWSVSVFSMALALSLVPGTGAALAEGECEVCVTFLGKFYKTLKEDGVKFTFDGIKTALEKSCRDASFQDSQFCYYIGVTRSPASPMVEWVIKPISYHLPVETICERLKSNVHHICRLKYPPTSSSSR